MNTRIKKLRKALDLTQEAFGNRIGVKRNTVATYELGRNKPIDSVVSLICREFHVNEEWLRTGEGEMFQPEPRDMIDELIEQYHLPREYRSLTEKYLELTPAQQEAVVLYMRKVAAALMEDDQDAEKPVPPGYSSRAEMEAEARAEAEDYYQEILLEKMQEAGLSVSSDTDGPGGVA